MDTWIQLLQTFGLAVVMLIFVGWCTIRVAAWLAPRLDRMVERSMQAVDNIGKIEQRLGDAEHRIDALWDFTLRRGTAEALQKGVATMNSPVRVTAAARQWLKGIAADLQTFYGQTGCHLSQPRLAAVISARWGQQLFKEVCLPNGIDEGTCLLIAIAVARGETDLSAEEINLPAARAARRTEDLEALQP